MVRSLQSYTRLTLLIIRKIKNVHKIFKENLYGRVFIMIAGGAMLHYKTSKVDKTILNREDWSLKLYRIISIKKI